MLKQVQHDELKSSQPLQRRAKPLGLSRFRVMVGAGLIDRLGLGALGEGWVREARGEPVAVFLRRRRAFRQTALFGFYVDMLGERKGISLAGHDDLRRPLRRRIRGARGTELG